MFNAVCMFACLAEGRQLLFWEKFWAVCFYVRVEFFPQVCVCMFLLQWEG